MKKTKFLWECLFCNRDYSKEPYAEATVRDKKGNSFSGFVCKDCFLRGLHDEIGGM